MDVADRLLEAHVAYTVRQLRGDGFVALVEDEVDHALADARRLTLDEAVHRDQVKAVVAKYVGAFALPGAIPEIAGEIATRLRSHPANDTAVGEVLPRRHVAAGIAKIAELQPVRERLAERIADSPSVQAWLADYLRSLAAEPLSTNRRLVEKLPGVSSALAVGEKLAGPAVREADQRSREVAERAAGALLRRWRDGVGSSLRNDDFAAALLEIWDGFAGQSMRGVLDSIGDDDLQDLVAVAYEGWLDLRTGSYLRALIDTGVDFFFDTYGTFTLDALLAEFGLGRDDLIEEALRFAPQAIEALARTGLLEAIARRRLAGFYRSPEAQAVLADR